MPLVKVELQKGYDRLKLIKLREIVMSQVVQTLQLSENDQNFRLIEYEPDFFQMKPPYKVIIEISLFSGRTPKTKKLLFQNLVQQLETHQLFERKEVFILLNEQPIENWGVRGGIPANELELGFIVEI
jgi:phenylpyruvate tautomerase PptA (4-oxalocrotonate tautomerase family)